MCWVWRVSTSIGIIIFRISLSNLTHKRNLILPAIDSSRHPELVVLVSKWPVPVNSVPPTLELVCKALLSQHYKRKILPSQTASLDSSSHLIAMQSTVFPSWALWCHWGCQNATEIFSGTACSCHLCNHWGWGSFSALNHTPSHADLRCPHVCFYRHRLDLHILQVLSSGIKTERISPPERRVPTRNPYSSLWPHVTGIPSKVVTGCWSGPVCDRSSGQ